ncbi:MAG: penicillin-binding protein 2 [Actinomycetota bacterium]
MTTDGKAGSRLKVLAGLVVLMFAALTVRLWFLQVLASEKYLTEASENAIRFVDQPAPRGSILDRNGEPLVENRTALQVEVNRQELPQDRAPVIRSLSRVLGVSQEALTRRIDDKRYYPFAPVPIAFDVDQKVRWAIAEHSEAFRGVDVQEVPAREYPQGDIAEHVVGYIGRLLDSQIEDPKFDGYDPNDTVGQGGLESFYEEDLRGDKGKLKLQVNAAGEVIKEIGSEPSVPGNDLVLALDAEIQAAAEEHLEQGMERARDAGFKATSGTAVVLDPNTGGIVAIASVPGFDPTIYDDGLNEREQKLLEIGEKRPRDARLLNRATSGEYPPGSTFKPFVGLAALREGIAAQGSQFDCDAVYSVPKDPTTTFRNWAPVNMGPMTIAQALPPSCDTVFYELGYQFWSKYYKEEGVRGPEVMQRALADLGFGTFTGIDLPTGSPGLIPTEQWKNETFSREFGGPYQDNQRHYCDIHFCPGDYILMGIGQGNVRVTPLQLALAYGAIQTGRLCEPRLALRTQEPGEGKTVREVASRCHELKGFSETDLKYVRSALNGVVQGNGTAAGAFAGFPFGQVSVGGKTGTAEIAGQAQDNSWFAAVTRGTVKGETEDYVVVVMVERGGHGAETAAPITRQIIETIYGLDVSKFHLGAAAD